MLARICLALCLLAGLTAWCQETTATADAAKATDDGSQLQAPPPVNGQAYATTFAGASESNYLRGGITFSGGYSTNVLGGTNPVSDMSYSVWPTIAFDKTTYRMHLEFDYAPGFTVYQHSSSLNQGNQNVAMNLQYHFTPNLSVSLQEGFQKTSNIFDQANPLSSTSVSGSAPTSTTAIIAPAASLMTNTTSVQFRYQISGDAMIGGGGGYSTLYYPSSQQDAGGLYNSRTASGSLFYSTRFREKNYVGVQYQYQNSLSFQSEAPSVLTQSQTIFFFITRYLNPYLSVSVSVGPQHYSAEQPGQVPAGSWQPLTMVSMNWQGERTTLAGSYARTVSGGGGLNGTFHSNDASLFASWRASKNWTTGVSGSYSNYQNLVPFFFLSNPGGHTLLGTASLQRTLNEHASIQFGYSWAHQSYLGIPTISNNPNTNRAFATLNFTFSRPLQR
jgi:hypothetical protein